MGFWSKLAKIGGAAAAGLAAPLTGGASLASLPAILGASAGALGAAGNVASGASQGRATGRVQEAGINQNQDLVKLRAAQLLEEALQGRRGLDLREREFGLTAPNARAGTAVRGDILAHAQDAGIRGPITHTRGQVPQITGGLRPSLLSGNTRALGSQMSRNALLQNMQGETFAPLPAPQIPDATPTPEAGKTDTALNWLSGIGTGVGALDEAGVFKKWKPKKPSVPQIPNAGPINPWSLPGWQAGA